MSKKTYAELLRSKKWQQKRLDVFQRDGWACCRCHSDSEEHQSLHIHHKRYITGNKPWGYELEDLETLCEECHRETHGIIDVTKYQLALNDEEQLVYYDLTRLKKLGFSLIGYLEQEECSYRYQNCFTIVHLSSNQTFKLFATKGLKAKIEQLRHFYTDDGFIYYKVPHYIVAFYEAIHKENEELTIIAGQGHK